MNKLLENINGWLKLRGPREHIFLFMLGFVVIYVVCFIIFIKPVSKHKHELQANIVQLQIQKDSIQKEINAVHSSMQDPVFIKTLNEEKTLVVKIKSMQAALKTMKPMLTNTSELAILTKTILTHPNNNITLVNLKELGERPWVPDIKNKSDLPLLDINNIFEHSYVIEFRGDYFSTIQYLTWIEKLPYHIYWDSMQYKVEKYPMADVLVTIRVLTKA